MWLESTVEGSWGTPYRTSSMLPENRRLGDYIHVDVSDYFTAFGKWTTFSVFVAAFVLMTICPSQRRPLMSLRLALLMILWRNLMLYTVNGPEFNVRRHVPMEPIILLFSSMVLHSALERSIKQYVKLKGPSIAWTSFLSGLWIQQAFMPESMMRNLSQNSPIEWMILTASSTLGSSLTLTSSFTNMMVVTLAYDEIGWLEFASTMMLPVAVSLAMLYLATLLVRKHTDNSLTNREMSTVTETMYDTVESQEIDIHQANDSENDKESETETSMSTVEEELQLSSSVEIVYQQDGARSGLLYLKATVVSGMIFLLAFGFDELWVTLSAGVLLVALDEQSATKDIVGAKQISVFDNVQFDFLVHLIAQCIIVGSLNDTGIPQNAFARGMGQCVDNIGSDLCVYRFASLFALFCMMISPLSAVLAFAAAFPYTAPHDWRFVAWIASITSHVSLFGFRLSEKALMKGHQFPSLFRTWICLVPFTFVALFVGIFCLVHVDFLPKCSVRLGDCVLSP